MSMVSDYDNSGPTPQLQKASDHNHSKLGIQDNINEPSSSKLVPNVSPPTDTSDTSQGNQKFAETSSRNIDTLNLHTFYQRHRSNYHWTKDHPLEQVRGNPSKPVQTRRQLVTTPEMCMFALTVSTAKPKNLKEAMVDHAYIDAMQEELHQFDRLKVWELVDKPFGKTVINLKWLWKNKKDEDHTVIHNKARLVAKGYWQSPRELEAANIDQSPPREMSLKEMEDLKQHYLDEMKSLSNELQIKDYRNEKIHIRFRRECEDMIVELKSKFNGMSIEINKKKELQYLEQVAKLSTYTIEPSRHFSCTCCDDDDYEESTIPLNLIDSQTPPVYRITPCYTDLGARDSLIMGIRNFSALYLKQESDEFKSLMLEPCSNPKMSRGYSGRDIDDESLSDEDVPEDNVKIYSNPLFEFDDEYISSDVNPLFNKLLEDIECKVSYDSILDESTLLVTPLSDSNEDECFTPSDDVELLLHHDSSTPMISVVSILEGFTKEPPLEDNDDLFDLESKGNEWKKILYNAPIDDVIFDPGGDIEEINAFLDIDISTDIEDGYHDSEGDILYLESLLSNDTILTLPPKCDVRRLSSSFLVFCVLWFLSRIASDFEASRARGFVHRPLDLQSFTCLFTGIRYPRFIDLTFIY
ncbi:hypothetical protein Tco_0132429 [Tanacetum coccineum]